MTEWLPAIKDFIIADVVRWTENIWSEKKRGRGKNAKNVLIGKQQVTGQITLIDDYVHVKVIEAVMLEQNGAKDSHLRKADEILRKKPETLINGNVERLAWSDEAARASVITGKPES